MIKRVLLICLTAYLILITVDVVRALDQDIPKPELVRIANQELKRKGLVRLDYFSDKENDGGRSLSNNEHLEGIRNLIVYGNPHGTFSQDRYRYLGYTMEDDFFTNFLFRNDATSSTALVYRDWQIDPFRNPNTRNEKQIGNSQGKFNNKSIFEDSIREGLKLISRLDDNGNIFDFPEEELKKRQWNEYVHVYQPPTSVSWGSGIMFHRTSDGRIWYLTVPMAPLEPDDVPPPDTGTIKADLKVISVTPEKLADGERGVMVTLDSSGSTATLNDENVAITARRYFDSAGNEYPTTNDTFVFPVSYAQPGSLITLNVRVFSQALSEAGIGATDEASVTIYVGREGQIEIDATGKLAADARGNEKFDVLRGIPTTESLYANITDAPQYLADVEYKLLAVKLNIMWK